MENIPKSYLNHVKEYIVRNTGCLKTWNKMKSNEYFEIYVVSLKITQKLITFGNFWNSMQKQ